jgi:hypothetical protein
LLQRLATSDKSINLTSEIVIASVYPSRTLNLIDFIILAFFFALSLAAFSASAYLLQAEQPLTMSLFEVDFWQWTLLGFEPLIGFSQPINPSSLRPVNIHSRIVHSLRGSKARN